MASPREVENVVLKKRGPGELAGWDQMEKGRVWG